jgi:hypothetical protein
MIQQYPRVVRANSQLRQQLALLQLEHASLLQ